MTMIKTVKEVAAGQFKATCLRLLDLVATEGHEYIVTKRGKPVARVVPLHQSEALVKRRPPADLRGSVVRFDRPDEPFFEVPDEWPDVGP